MSNLTEDSKGSNALLAMAIANAQSQIDQTEMDLTVLTGQLPLCTVIFSAEVHFTIEPVNSNETRPKT